MPERPDFNSIAQQEGWTETTQIWVLLRYIENQDSNEAFEGFLERMRSEDDLNLLVALQAKPTTRSQRTEQQRETAPMTNQPAAATPTAQTGESQQPRREWWERTSEAPFPIEAKTGRAFISPCCTSSVSEFLIDGTLWLANSVAGHGWGEPWKGSVDTINDTGTVVDADGKERRVYWRRDRDSS